jgi:hypothetical protein
MFKIFTKIPILGVLLKVFNSYAYEGDIAADERFAGTRAWIRSFFFPCALSSAVALILMPDIVNSLFQCNILRYQVSLAPGPLSTSILPNLLGFGIGVYALIFALDRKLVQDLQGGFETHNKNNKKTGSALLLNTEMALPLIVITTTVSIGIFQQIFSDLVVLKFFSWFSLWLSLYFTLDLINNLFMIGSAHLSEHIKK